MVLFFFFAVIRQRQLRKEMLVLAHSVRTQSILVWQAWGRSRRQPAILLPGRKQSWMTTDAQLSVLFHSAQERSLPTLVNPIQTPPHTYTQRFVSCGSNSFKWQ